MSGYVSSSPVPATMHPHRLQPPPARPLGPWGAPAQPCSCGRTAAALHLLAPAPSPLLAAPGWQGAAGQQPGRKRLLAAGTASCGRSTSAGMAGCRSLLRHRQRPAPAAQQASTTPPLPLPALAGYPAATLAAAPSLLPHAASPALLPHPRSSPPQQQLAALPLQVALPTPPLPRQTRLRSAARASGTHLISQSAPPPACSAPRQMPLTG